ncbi:MAG: strawberry notch C-terminal domain-containing protein, partial [Deltaproteobacteria bacterium]|nr:strawberry notch C-terminal domain-containing protein [Deltaproteobacteria bacterium]
VRDDEGNLKVVEEKRGKNVAMADAASFQSDKKDILVFSEAGGTGYSFHADNTAQNQRKRIHYILQPGWRADKAVQGFGRTHRTNQAQDPHYVLPTTNLKAQKRFVSSIARRLDQLGALTRGQREATSQGLFTASDNLESEYAGTALRNLFRDLYADKTNLSFQDVTRQMGLSLTGPDGGFDESKIPSIPQFLNRLLSLTTDMQNDVSAEFEQRLVETVEYAKQRGMYDEGLQTIKAVSIQKTRDDIVFEEKNAGAKTRYVELAVTNEIQYEKWEDARLRSEKRREQRGDLSGWFVSEFGKNKGEVFYLKDIGERLNAEGNLVRRGVIHSIRKNDH